MRTGILFFVFLIAQPTMRAQVFMRPPDNAAALGMGGASVAFPGMDLGISNDALPARGEGWGVYAGSALPYGLADFQTAIFQAYAKLGQADALSLDVVHSGIEVYSEQRFRLRYARRLGEKIYLGVGGEMMRVSANEYGSANTFTAGIGFLANPLSTLWIGGQLNNPFQQELQGTTLPTVFKVGAAWKPSKVFAFTGEMEKDLERDAEVKFGIQYHPNDLLVFRAGVRTHPGRPSLGVGVLVFDHLFIDFGAEWHTSLGFTPALLLGYRF